MTPSENIEAWRARVTLAAIGYETRWSELRLWEVNPDLAQRLKEQRALFRTACDGGKPGEVAEHGAAMCRGYAAATQALEDAHAINDAYRIGYDPQTNTHVAIGVGKAGAQRAAENNPRIIYLTYDEVAALLGRVASLKPIVAAKRQWPGCEILGEPIIGEQPINHFDQPIPADETTEQDT